MIAPPTCSGAASSTDVVVVNDSVREDAEIPEYRVRRTEDGEWEPATTQEAAEFRAHDEAVAAEQELQAKRDTENYQMVEAAMQQRWDDWAMRSELDRAQQLPSRKRIRVVLTVGSPSGTEIGGAEVVGTMDADQVPVVSFRVEETVLGGIEGGAGVEHGPLATAAHAAPQLANFDPECLPGLSQEMIDIMNTKEARHWLHLFSEELVTKEVVIERLGLEVSEVFEMWVAVQQDNNEAARNCGELVVGRPRDGDGNDQEVAGTSTSSEASTVAFDKTVPPLEEMDRRGEEHQGKVGDGVENAGAAEAGNAGEEEEGQQMDVDVELEVGMETERGNDGEETREIAENAGAVAAEQADEAESLGTNQVEGLPTAGLASRMEETATESGEESGGGHGALRGDDDELDPETGIPLRWAQFWRGVNANRSIGVGIPDPHERNSASMSDGFDTMPGNYVPPTQADEGEGLGEGEIASGGLSLPTSSGSTGAGAAAAADDDSAVVAPGAPGEMETEHHAASTTELHRRVISRQTDLTGWLKRDA